jgi:uncharacterized membrane protein
MSYSPVLWIHIASGTVGVIAGFTAVFLLKGSRRHGLTGNVFVLAMISLALSATYLAIRKSQVTNVLGAGLTFYLVTTAWVAAKRRDGQPGIWDWAALSIGSAVGIAEIIFGVQAALSPTGMKYDYPPAPYFIFGGVALIAVIGDVRMLLRGGITGTRRLARHLWRMCFALFIASASIFLARPQLFPAFFKKTGILALLSFLPLILLVFWLIRIRVASKYKNKVVSRGLVHPAIAVANLSS